MREKGQAILALILIMTVALAIGVSIIQKSLVDVSTSTKVEQSQRAFSAAEAGIEQALRGQPSPAPNFTENQSSAKVQDANLLPRTVYLGQQQDALEYPPISKEEFAHIWLADPTSNANPPAEFYMPVAKNSSRGIEIYWGDPKTTDKAAIQIKIIYFDGSIYQTLTYYFDPDNTRAQSNGFTPATINDCSSPSINTIFGTNRIFYCREIITSPFPSSGLMLVRIRLLYTSTSQPVAVRGYGTCGIQCSLPPQARIIVSTGTSGQTQRIVQLFQINNVVLPYFDFAIFSAGAINK